VWETGHNHAGSVGKQVNTYAVTALDLPELQMKKRTREGCNGPLSPRFPLTFTYHGCPALIPSDRLAITM
jgi:hypothetical protein